MRFPALDGLRGLAALAVVTTHVSFDAGRNGKPGILGPLFSRCDFGVTLFFLLSGFLLYRPMVGGPKAPATYAKRRALRVLPVYWVTIVAAFTLEPDNAHVTTRDWVEHLLLIQTYTGNAFHGGVTQFWSLATEVAFYALLPVLAWLMSRLRRPELVLAVMVVIGLAWTIHRDSSWPITANLWLPGFLDWFALGMGLALLHARGNRTLSDLGRAPGTCLSVGALLFALAATPIGGSYTLERETPLEQTTKHVLYGLAALMLLIPIVFAPSEGNLWSRALSLRPLQLLGKVSYSLFAVHQLVIYFLVRDITGREFGGHFPTVWWATVAVSLAISAVSWRLIESPGIALGHRSLRQRGQHRPERREHEALRQG